MQYTNSASRFDLLGLFIKVMISSSIAWVAGTLKDEYRILAILSVLLVITSILNSESGAYVTLAISRSITLDEAVLWSKSLSKWSMLVYSGFY